MKRDNKLKLHFNKKLNDIEGMLPLSETQGRWDIYLLFLSHLCTVLWLCRHERKRHFQVYPVRDSLWQAAKDDSFFPEFFRPRDFDSFRRLIHHKQKHQCIYRL